MQDKRLFFAKLKDLLRTPTYDDITFNCKDGKIHGNRLILSIYSNFLVNVFKDNPLITSHPVYNSPDSGINLPEVKVRDVENLLKAVNGSDFVEIKSNHLTGVQNLAKVLEIELVAGQSYSGLTNVKVIPKLSPDCEEDFDDNDDGPLSVKCEQSLVEDDNILHLSDLDEVVNIKAEPKSPLDEEVDEDTDLNGYENVSSSNVTKNYQGLGLKSSPGNPSCSKIVQNGLKRGMKDEMMKNSFEEDTESVLGYNDDVDNDPDFRFAGRHRKRARGRGRGRNPLRRDSVKMEPLDTNDLNMVDGSEEMSEIPDDFELPECSTAEKVCPFCNITCKSWQGLKSHIGLVHRNSDERHAPQQKHVCKCGKMFTHSSRTLYKEHRQNCEIYRKEAFICEHCKAPFDSMPALNNHKYSVHGVIIKARTCVCGQSFDTGHSFRKHEINCEVYRRAAMFCGECNLPFLTKGHLKQHLQSTGHFHEDNEGLLLESSQKVVVCKCGKTFSKHSKSLYKEHREVCTEFMKEAFICDICNSAFNEMPSLKNHKYRAHGILKEPNSCVCGMTFGSGWSCRKHSITCEVYRSAAIFCEECQLPFLTKGHLEQHVRSSAHRSAGDNKWNTSLLTKGGLENESQHLP